MDKVKELLITLDLMADKLKELFDEVNRQQIVIDKQSQAIILLSEYAEIRDCNGNFISDAPATEIKKILE